MSLFQQIPSTTKRAYLKRVADGVYAGNPLLWMLTQKKKQQYQGGELIVQPLIATQTNGGSFEAWDALTAADANDVDAARYNWVSYYGAAAISGQDYFKNMGPEQAVNLLGAKMANAELTIKEKMAVDMYLVSGSANPTGLTSVDEIVDGGTITVGGLTSTDVASWAGQNVSGGNTLVTLAGMETLYTSCSEGDEEPDLMVTDKTVYAKIWSLLQANQRYLGADNKVGFKNLLFNNAALTFDSHCVGGTGQTTSGSYSLVQKRLYAFNTNYFQLAVHKDVEFVMEEKVPTNQWGYLAYIYWMGNLTCNNRRFQGCIDDLTG